MERRSCHTDHPKQCSFGRCHVSLPTETLQSPCVSACMGTACSFCKNRWEVEYPSNALLTLLSSFLCSPSDSVSVLLSLTVPPRWRKEEKTVSTGCFPLMDIVCYPRKLCRFTLVIVSRSATHISFLTPALTQLTTWPSTCAPSSPYDSR